MYRRNLQVIVVLGDHFQITMAGMSAPSVLLFHERLLDRAAKEPWFLHPSDYDRMVSVFKDRRCLALWLLQEGASPWISQQPHWQKDSILEQTGCWRCAYGVLIVSHGITQQRSWMSYSTIAALPRERDQEIAYFPLCFFVACSCPTASSWAWCSTMPCICTSCWWMRL